jgi:hypothetical protein
MSYPRRRTPALRADREQRTLSQLTRPLMRDGRLKRAEPKRYTEAVDTKGNVQWTRTFVPPLLFSS